MDFDKKIAFENIQKSVSLVLEKIPEDVLVIFENTSGQETEVGSNFKELREIYDMFSEKQKQRMGFCLDTCHSHVAGYDLSTKKGVENWKKEFDESIGWDKVRCIHLNDAKNKFNSRLDGHSDISFGTIGENGLKEVVRIAKETNKPLILETSANNISYDKQIERVKEWAK